MNRRNAFYDEIAEKLEKGKTLLFDVPDGTVPEGLRGRLLQAMAVRCPGRKVYSRVQGDRVRISLSPLSSPTTHFSIPYKEE